MHANKLILLFVAVLLVHTAHTQQLKGIITDENKNPIKDAHIQLLREGVLRGETITDRRGKYVIYPINKGGYMALIKVGGKDRLIQKIDINTDTVCTIDFALRKRAVKK
jgi:mRNA-degrading endonuclease RelE of RelBE toxin-antitoxin system